MFVSLYNSIDSIDFRVKDVAIKGEAVTCFSLFRDKSTIPKHWHLLITVIVLQNVAH